jgi:hypothetical protein
MIESPDQMVLLEGDEVPQLVHAKVAGGLVAAYTSRSPDKSTPNEDTVAVIPYGPGAAVLVIADGAGGLPAGRRASRTAVMADYFRAPYPARAAVGVASLPKGADVEAEAVLAL